MEKDNSLPYQGIRWKELVTLYNQAELGLSGFEKILNIYSHLKKSDEEFAKNIESDLKSSIRKCLEQRGDTLEMVDDFYRKVESIFFNFPVYKDLDFIDWCITKFESLEIFRTKFILKGSLNAQASYAEEIAYALDDLRAPVFIRVRTDRIRLEIFMEHVILRGYPDKVDIDDDEIKRQREKEKKRLDKILGKHKHRADDIRNKYRELKQKNQIVRIPK